MAFRWPVCVCGGGGVSRVWAVQGGHFHCSNRRSLDWSLWPRNLVVKRCRRRDGSSYRTLLEGMPLDVFAGCVLRFDEVSDKQYRWLRNARLPVALTVRSTSNNILQHCTDDRFRVPLLGETRRTRCFSLFRENGKHAVHVVLSVT